MLDRPGSLSRWLVLAIVGVAMTALSASAQANGSLAGVVRDTAGTPVRDAEVVLIAQNRATRTNDRGEFALTDVAPGAYRVWFRRLGYASVEYAWAAHAGQRLEISVVLSPIARTLDPVVVRAEEDRRAKAHASLLGLVVDAEGNPLPEAQVQLVGADIAGTTRSNGGFLFKPLGVGSYVLRVRKLGYTPEMLTLQLVENDDREVVIRMDPLPVGLDAVQINDRSGYGADQRAYEDLEQRKRYVSSFTRFLGPGDLKSFYGVTLDIALVRMGLSSGSAPRSARVPTSIDPKGTRRVTSDDPSDVACILLNGKEAVEWPLHAFSTDDVELLEVWPSGTELTGTVGWHFHSDRCRARGVYSHPTYWVVWLKKQ